MTVRPPGMPGPPTADTIPGRAGDVILDCGIHIDRPLILMFQDLNPKQQDIAINIFAGMDQLAAYRNSCANQQCEDMTAQRAVRTVLANPKVALFMSELKDRHTMVRLQKIDRAARTRDGVIERLYDEEGASLFDVCSMESILVGYDKESKPITRQFLKMRPEVEDDPRLRNLIESVTIRNGEVQKITLRSAQAARKQLREVEGMDKPKQLEIRDRTTEERIGDMDNDEVIAQLRERGIKINAD